MRTDNKMCICIIWIILSGVGGVVHFFYMINYGFCLTNETFEKLSNKIKENTIQLTSTFTDGETEYGFGFIIGAKSDYLYIVTARHVVIKMDHDEKRLKASIKACFFYDQGVKHEATILDVKKGSLDLALIRLRTPKNFNFSENYFSYDIKRNEKVWFVGKKMDWYVPFSYKPGGVVREPDFSGVMTVEISTISRGTSGAPLFSEKGIVGLIISDNVNNAKAISIQAVKDFVQSVNYPWGKETFSSDKKNSLDFSVKTKDKGVKQFTNNIGMTFMLISAGTFIIGSPNNEQGRHWDEKQQLINLKYDYYIQTTEVTQSQWQLVMGYNPSYFQYCGEHCPVENVSWYDVQIFINKLNAMDINTNYRLPTEVEWEYAARAGTQTPFAFGYCLSTNDENYYAKNRQLKGCPTGIMRDKTLPVGSLRKNAWGLFDIHGNVSEWCLDIYYGDLSYYGSYNKNGRLIAETMRVVKGGYWGGRARNCRSAARIGNYPDTRSPFTGFRLYATIR